MTSVPGIELAVCDCTLDDVPDMAVRPLAELVRLARQANTSCDETQYTLAGWEFGAVLGELHVHAATGTSDTRRVALAALVEACIAASGTVRALGHGTLQSRPSASASASCADPRTRRSTSRWPLTSAWT